MVFMKTLKLYIPIKSTENGNKLYTHILQKCPEDSLVVEEQFKK